MPHTSRKAGQPIKLGISDENVVAGDHIAYFYETDSEFERAFGFLDVGLQGKDHCVVFGIAEDTERSLKVLKDHGWEPDALIAEGRLSVLVPCPTCEETFKVVSEHFDRIYSGGAQFIRFLGNAAVGREGWPSEKEFYKLEATVSEATLNMPCVAICMFDLRVQPARTIMRAAFEGHPVTLHRNCIRENPFYVPRAEQQGEVGHSQSAGNV